MNTRRKFIQPKAEVPSVRWHLMHESYHAMFTAEAREHVEDWYNLGATGVQRDLFRAVCAEIYKADPNAAEPANRPAYTAVVAKEEADLMVKYYTKVLTELGKRKAHTWILHSTNPRRRDNFRDVFGGCQTVFEKKSVMQRDYTAPEAACYDRDNTHAHRSVDWTSLRARCDMQTLQAQRRNGGADAASGPSSSSSPAPSAARLAVQRPSAVVAARNPAPQRTTKPKNQFDGVNNLASLGYGGDVPAEVAIAELKAKHQAFAQERSYYVDKDGSTVFVAANAGRNQRGAAVVSEGGMLAAVTSEPMQAWKVKTCD